MSTPIPLIQRAAEEIYITDIELHNWQGHIDTKIKITVRAGVVAFVGTSNAGKSSVLRAILFCLDNKLYDQFITDGQDDCWVAVGLSNGYRIKRRRTRSNSVNTYEVFQGEQRTHDDPLTGFGTGIPELVKEVRGMNRIKFNFSRQLDAAFLISESPASRAETIGTFEELVRIDEALQGTNDDIRLGNKRSKELDKEIKALEKEAAALTSEIAKAKPKAETIRTLRKGLQEKEYFLMQMGRSASRLQEIDIELTAIREEIMQAERIIEQWKEDLPSRIEVVQTILKWGERLVTIESEMSTITFMNAESLEYLASIVYEVDHDIQVFQATHRSAQRLMAIQDESQQLRTGFSEVVAALDYTKVDKEIESFRILLKHNNRLDEIQNEVKRTQQEVGAAHEKIDVLLEQFVEALQTAEVCPTCSQSTSAVTCEHIKQVV